MKYTIILILIFFCNGCLTGLVQHQFCKNSEGSYPIQSMKITQAGITEDNNFVINLSNSEGLTFLVNGKSFNRALIYWDGKEYRMTHEEIDSIVRDIPISTSEVNGEHLRVLGHNIGLLRLEYKDKNQFSKTIEVKTNYSRDPYLIKRSALVLAYPLAFSLDAGLAIFAGLGGASSAGAFSR